MKRLWLLVLMAAVGLMVLLQHWGIDQTSNDFVVRTPRLPVPTIKVVDGAGAKTRGVEDLRGKFVLLNIWATWCVPCRKELPSLDRLREQLGGPDFEVVALSVDRDGAEAVKNFYREIGIRSLPVRVAADSSALAALGAYGLPTTLLIDPESKEIGRLVGSARWGLEGNGRFPQDEDRQVERIEGPKGGDAKNAGPVPAAIAGRILRLQKSTLAFRL